MCIRDRDAIELKKLLHLAEEKYRFSIYNGDPLNIVNYLKSDNFKTLVSFVKSCQAVGVLGEILGKLKEVYTEYPDVLNALSKVEESLKEEATASTGIHVDEETMHMETLVDLLKEELNASDIVVERNTIKARFNEESEFKISVFKQHVKIEIKFKKSIDKRDLNYLFKKVMEIAEKTIRVRL